MGSRNVGGYVSTIDSSAHQQFDSLKRMRFLLGGSLHTDALAMIDSILPNTKLRSTLVYRWIQTSYHASQSIHVNLENRFFAVKKDLVDHLDKQICKVGLYLMHHKHTISPDPFWLCKANEVTDPWVSNKDRLDALCASLHLGDVVFAAKEVVDQIHEKKSEFSAKELTPFIEKSLPQYLALLPLAPAAFKTQITTTFQDLHTSILSDNPDVACKHLLALQNIIRS
jgi:hypothetical protein